MAVCPFESTIFGPLFGDREAGALFADSTAIRAMLLVEGELARAQGRLGLIPEESGEAIWHASRHVQIDPADLAAGAARSAVVVPALVAAFRNAMQAPEHAQFLHWGATSQDIMDTALALHLRQLLDLAEQRLTSLAGALGKLAGHHAELPMTARTWGQAATPTSFGAVVAGWGAPLLVHLRRLDELRPRVLQVSLFGAAGTSAAFGEKSDILRKALAEALNLHVSPDPWHTARGNIAELAGWATLVTGTLGKMGRDLELLVQTGIGEVSIGAGGGSSTMPQKNNPVLPALLVALAGHVSALNTSIQGAMVHAHQRDGAAWVQEWLALPQVCIALARSLGAANELASRITPQADKMQQALQETGGMVFAEALSFALAKDMPRTQAVHAVKQLCRQASENGQTLESLARKAFPSLDHDALFCAARHMGTAPEDARRFALQAARLEQGAGRSRKAQ